MHWQRTVVCHCSAHAFHSGLGEAFPAHPSKTVLRVHTLYFYPLWFYFSSWLLSQPHSVYLKPQLEYKFYGLGVLFELFLAVFLVLRAWQVIGTQSVFARWIHEYRTIRSETQCCLWRKWALELGLLEFRSQQCHFLADTLGKLINFSEPKLVMRIKWEKCLNQLAVSTYRYCHYYH